MLATRLSVPGPVIDWCQYDQQTGAGIWSDDQIIKVQNSLAPVFVNCQDTVFNAINSDCSAPVILSVTVEDDCTPSSQIQVDWKIDLDNDGTYDISGFGRTIDIDDLQTGTHRVLWSALDQCGNAETCSHLLIVRDDKLPTPICIAGLSTVVMPNGGQVTIWASDFNAGSFDNCTADEDLLYSFSGENYQPSMTIDCDALVQNGGSTFELQIWVSDAGGNWDYCTTYVVVEDNEGACTGLVSGSIAGDNKTYYGETVSGIDVKLINVEIPVDTFTTEDDGFYLFANLPTQSNYTVLPGKDGDDMNGVSTLDLLKIQKHLLDVEPFVSPYQYIAGDANNSEHVSVIDILELRKLILGIYSELPDNTSWRFVSSEFEFIDPVKPWPFDEVRYYSPLLADQVKEDFIAVKVGDLNENAQVNFTESIELETRSTMKLETYDHDVLENETFIVPIIAGNDFDLTGFQFTVEFDGLCEFVGNSTFRIKCFQTACRIAFK